LFMHFSGELELHDGIGRADSVGNVLQYRQILPAHPASATEPARAPAGRKVRRDVLRASSGRAGVDWGVSCGPRSGCLLWPLLTVIANRPTAAGNARTAPIPTRLKVVLTART